MMISKALGGLWPGHQKRNIGVCPTMFLHGEMKEEIGNIVKTIEAKIGLSNV